MGSIAHATPLVSIVVPVRDGAEYLPACMASILAQSHQRIEVVAVDDGSRDETPALLASMKQADCRLVVLRTEGLGVACARNRGLAAATGEYVLFVDADDLVHRELVSRLVGVADRVEADVIVSSLTQFDRNADVDCPLPKTQLRLLSPKSSARELLYERTIAGGAVAKLYHRGRLGHLRFPEGASFAEDLRFSFDTSTQSRAVAVTNLRGYWYRQHGRSAVHRSFDGQRMSGLDVVESIAASVSGDEFLERAAAHRVFMEATHILLVPGVSQARWNQERERCIGVLRSARRGVLADPQARWSGAKLLAVASFLGPRGVRAAVSGRRAASLVVRFVRRVLAAA